MTAGQIRRISMELEKLKATDMIGVSSIGPVGDPPDLFHWNALLLGPTNTPYEGCLLELDIVLADGYPFKPPRVKFTHPVYHPSVQLEFAKALYLDIL